MTKIILYLAIASCLLANRVAIWTQIKGLQVGRSLDPSPFKSILHEDSFIRKPMITFKSQTYEFVVEAESPSEDFPLLCTYTKDGKFKHVYHSARSAESMQRVLRYIKADSPQCAVYWWHEQTN